MCGAKTDFLGSHYDPHCNKVYTVQDGFVCLKLFYCSRVTKQLFMKELNPDYGINFMDFLIIGPDIEPACYI